MNLKTDISFHISQICQILPAARQCYLTLHLLPVLQTSKAG